MIWAGFITVYSLIGGYFMFKYGDFIYFRFYEWDIFGGLAMFIAFVALMNVFAFSNRSLSFTSVCKWFWSFIIILSSIRAIIMIVEGNANKPKIQYECDHGGYLYGALPSSYVNGTVPSFNTSICSYGVPTFYSVLVIVVLIDLGCQIYMLFLNWRFLALLERYDLMMGPKEGAYYT